MLLGSFQQLPHKDGKICKINEVDRLYYDSLGFKPIWCFPITEDYLMSYFQCLTVAPNIPQIFMIFDTDDYVRIDRIKHYSLLNDSKDKYDLSGCIDDNVLDLYSEFVIDAATAEEHLKYCVNLLMINPFMEGQCDMEQIFKYFSKFPKDCHFYFRSEMRKTPLWDYENIDAIVDSMCYEVTAEMFKIMKDNLHIFVHNLFPLIYEFLFEEQFSVWRINSIISNQMERKINNDFTSWSINDLSVEGYDSLFEKFKPLVIQKYDLFADIEDNKLPYPNSICPYCNSGKKFKKCCGKYCR